MGHQIEIAIERMRDLAVDNGTGSYVTRFVGFGSRVWNQANVVPFCADDVRKRGVKVKSYASTCSLSQSMSPDQNICLTFDGGDLDPADLVELALGNSIAVEQQALRLAPGASPKIANQSVGD